MSATMEETLQDHEIVEEDDDETTKGTMENSDNLRKKVEDLELMNNQIREEFNGQRAKMKELFLQKEEEAKRKREEYLRLQEANKKLENELNEIKSQLVVIDLKTQNDNLEKQKAQEEIASLQQVINETVEESSSSTTELDVELRKLQSILMRLEEDNNMLRAQIIRYSAAADSPQLSLSTMTKTLAKKVASQLGADSLSLGPDNNDDSLSKVKRHVRKFAK